MSAILWCVIIAALFLQNVGVWIDNVIMTRVGFFIWVSAIVMLGCAKAVELWREPQAEVEAAGPFHILDEPGS
jgi:hypothetical protein